MSDGTGHTLFLDGEEVTFARGESILQVAERNQRDIPTLCHDDRLDPSGSCRLCIVEIEGAPRPVSSCTTKAEPGMRVTTKSGALEMHRRVLLEMVASENPVLEVDELSGLASRELTTLVDRYDARTSRFQGRTSGTARLDDPNPFIQRDYSKCISCYRCVRVCAEQEGDHAISVVNRGFKSQISTEFGGLLKDSACTFCGQCVQTCPTGALADLKALRHADLEGPVETTRSACPYCGVGCSVDIMTKGDRIIGVRPAMDGPANEGALCVKGQFAVDFVHHPDRLKTPFVRDDHGNLVPTTWDEALDKAAAGLLTAVNEHGRHSVYAVASGRAPNEAGFLMQKFVRAGLGTSYIDNCSRA